jgi:hypothetical protein
MAPSKMIVTKASYWTLDEKKERVAIFWVNFGPDNKEPIKVKVNHYQGRIYVDIRYYFWSVKEKVWKPKKGGVNFNIPDWESFEMIFGDVKQAVVEMKREFCPDRAPLSAYMEGADTDSVPPLIESGDSEEDAPGPSRIKKRKIDDFNCVQ